MIKMSNNRHKALFAAIATATLLTAACGTKGDKTSENSKADSTGQQLPGESMVYGLACDGCNDTILVLLPPTGEDPDTLNILNASKEQQVFGRLTAGDKVGVMLNPQDRKVADIVIDIDKLKGEWCYMVEPQLRQRADFDPSRLQPEEREKMDSILKQMMQPREYGMNIKSENIVQPIGARVQEGDGPAVFPPQKRYREWHLFNGRLLLSETQRDTAGVSTVTNTDTTQLVMMRRDSLVLRFSDGTEKGFYRKMVKDER